MTDPTAISDLTYDPYDLATAINPHPVFRRLREEAPLYYSERHGFYAVSRFEDVERVHLDRETYICGRGVTLETLKANTEIPPGTVIFEDPPTHAIHRGLLARMFSPKSIAGLESEIRQLCARLLDPLVGSGGFDFASLAAEVPMRVIGMLVGIPEHDQESIRDHFDDNRQLAREDRDDTLTGSIFAEYIDWRAEHPSDDIMTHLLHVEFLDEHGTARRLTREEILAYVNIVAAAGNETTRMLIGWTCKVLADQPDQRRLLVEDPALIPNAIDELLRFEPPPLQSCRYVARDVELHGQTVPAGSIMALLLGAANRDDRRFRDPDSFDVRRRDGQHLTFGVGAHYCLGQALARLEGRVVLEEVLRRFPAWDVDWGNARFLHAGADLRGWAALPVSIP